MKRLVLLIVCFIAVVANAQTVTRRLTPKDMVYKVGSFDRASQVSPGTTVSRPGFTPINVLAFGVDNTGAESCADSLQAVVDSVIAWGGGDIYMPPGTYKNAQAVSFSDSSVVFIGEGVPRNLSGGGPRILRGHRSPVNYVYAPVGSLYMRWGDADSVMFYKSSGDDSTGWVCYSVANNVRFSAISDSLVGAYSNIDTLLYSDPFNVKRYGAIGDGTTDDRAAILAAITAADAAGGGTVYFPAGTYEINSEVQCVNIDNVTIRGDGATVVANTSMVTAMFGFYSCNNITIQSMRIDGNDLAQWGFDFKGCSNLLIQDVEIFDAEQQPATGNYAAGIRAGNYVGEGGSNVSIRDCYIHDIESTVSNASRGIVFYTYGSTDDAIIRDITISGCTFRNISPVNDGDGIVFQMTNSSGTSPLVPINASVVGCRFYNCYKRGVKIQNEGVSVVGNQFYTDRTGTWGGSSWSGFQYSGVSVYESNCVVSGNIFMASDGATFQYGVDTDGGTRSLQNIVISNNTVQNDTTATGESTDPWQQAYGFRVARADANGTTSGVVLSGNTVFATKYAYWIGQDVDNVNVFGNVDRYSTTNSLLVYTPSDTISGLTVHGNTFNSAVAMGLLLNKTSVHLSGTVSPEGVYACPVGSLYTRADNDSIIYVKQTDNGNIGWVLK